MSNNNNNNTSLNRNGYGFPDFSLRRLLLQTRGGRSSYTGRMCDLERGTGSNSTSGGGGGSASSTSSVKGEKNLHGTSSSSSAAGNKMNTESTSHGVGPHTTSSHALNSSGNQRSSSQRMTASYSASSSGSGGGNSSSINTNRTIINNQECPLCYGTETAQGFFILLNCKHYACRNCLESYLTIEIFESRTEIACPQCTESMHPSDISTLLRTFPTVMKKYEDFMVRRVLLSDPDSRWCPAPDCSYAVIATGCASCPRIRCERPGCDVNFCYHCKAEWHPDQTCDAARASRHSPMRAASGSISQDSQHRGDDIKPCPRCQVLIVKMDDGSCNHMVCAVCGSEFCWLCMKEISDLHYLSPSGCTFWGKKPWSRKKKLLWQLGTLIGAPVGIALVAGIAVPAMIIGIPVWIGRKLHTRYRLSGKHKRNCAVLGGVAASVLVSPVLAGLAVAIGVPILLFYVYGVVPVSLCRAGCAVSTTRDGFKFDFDDEDNSSRNQDATSVDAISRIGATSIGEVSLSVASGSHLGVSSQNNAFMLAQSHARASTTALSGSITGNKMEVQADVSASETASAVTCVSEKSNNTMFDNASTKALAGSMYKQHMDSSNVSEDGASERVRFDSTVCYVLDNNKKEYLDTDMSNADKASVGSERSYRTHGDDADTSSLSSVHKRSTFASRLPILNSNSHRHNISLDSGTSVSNNIPEVDDQLLSDENLSIEDINVNTATKDCTIIVANQSSTPHIKTKSALDVIDDTEYSANKSNESAAAASGHNTKESTNSKNLSKAAMLRQLFFSQINQNNNTATTSDSQSSGATDIDNLDSVGTIKK